MRLAHHVYFSRWERGHCFQFSSFFIVLFSWISRDWSFIPACRTARAEDVWIGYKRARQKLSSFHFCWVHNSLIQQPNTYRVMLPCGQLVHVIWPRELIDPALHSVATDAVHSCPAGQSMQVSWPGVGWYVPRTVHWVVTQNNNYWGHICDWLSNIAKAAHVRRPI